MYNHTKEILSSQLTNILFAEEVRIKEKESVAGNVEVDRVLPRFLELIFDGYKPKGGHPFRLIGKYNLETKMFSWE